MQLAWPDRPVLALLGDGAAMYGIQGLWTAARYRIPVTFVICNNAQYQILKIGAANMGLPQAAAGRFVGMDFVEPEVDFVGLAASSGRQRRANHRAGRIGRAGSRIAPRRSSATIRSADLPRSPRQVELRLNQASIGAIRALGVVEYFEILGAATARGACLLRSRHTPVCRRRLKAVLLPRRAAG